MAFPAYQAAGSRCYGAQPGAKALMSWALTDYKQGVYNLGINVCRSIAGKATKSVHGEGRALDLGFRMVNGRANPAGTRLVNMLLPHVGKLGIQCIIWNRTIWSRKNPKGARYNGASPHYDHVHVELTWAAAYGLTLATIRAAMRGVKVTPPPPAVSNLTELQKFLTSMAAATKHTLGPGRTNPSSAVKALQLLLNTKKGAGLVLDGKWGPKTEAAVRRFQSDVQKLLKLTNKQFPVDGIVGPATWFWLTM